MNFKCPKIGPLDQPADYIILALIIFLGTITYGKLEMFYRISIFGVIGAMLLILVTNLGRYVVLHFPPLGASWRLWMLTINCFALFGYLTMEYMFISDFQFVLACVLLIIGFVGILIESLIKG